MIEISIPMSEEKRPFWENVREKLTRGKSNQPKIGSGSGAAIGSDDDRAKWSQFLEEYKGEIRLATHESRVTRDENWQQESILLPFYVRPLFQDIEWSLQSYQQDIQKRRTKETNDKFKIIAAYNEVEATHDKFLLWLFKCRCIKYRIDGIKEDVDVLKLNASRLADSILDSDECNKNIANIWAQTLIEKELTDLNNDTCPTCRKAFKAGDCVKRLPCKPRSHCFHEVCIEAHLLSNNDCPVCGYIVY